MRIDLYLSENGYCESRSRAKALIEGGAVKLNGAVVTKPSLDIDGGEIEIESEILPFVSRGGLKLSEAARSFSLDFNGLTVCDVGASCGGFTDFCLQNGAKKVYAVDSGQGQLHPSLVKDKRVVNIERFNAKDLNVDVLGEECDCAVADLSFISQTKLYPAICSILKPKAFFVSLIKPQFEAGRENIGKGGIVKDKTVHIRVIKNIITSAISVGLYPQRLCKSPIKGGDGNTEYLMLFYRYDSGAYISEEQIKQTVKE